MHNSFEPIRWEDLNADEKLMILETHTLMTQKNTGLVKSRLVMGGNKQKPFIAKEDSSSPTAHCKSLTLSCIIDAAEGRCTVITDIPNAFIQARVQNRKEKTILRLRRLVVDILLILDQDKYGPYIFKGKHSNNCLIVRCPNAIYTLDYHVNGECHITIISYIEAILAAFKDAEPKYTSTKSSAAPADLFKVDEECVKLSPSKGKTFHNLVAKILFATKRARPDTCTELPLSPPEWGSPPLKTGRN
jgi:hypothetical protein